MRKAADRLSDTSWTQGCLARNQNGEEVDYDAESAAQWCLVGALNLESENLFLDPMDESEAFDVAFEAIQDNIVRPAEFSHRSFTNLSVWNDKEGRTAEEVRSLLNKSAEKLEVQL